MTLEPEQIVDRLQYWEGYLRGCSTVLGSAGQVDPLALSGSFEDCSRDIAAIKNSILSLFYSEEEETPKKDKKKK